MIIVFLLVIAGIVRNVLDRFIRRGFDWVVIFSFFGAQIGSTMRCYELLANLSGRFVL